MKISVGIAAYFTNSRHGIPSSYLDDPMFFIKMHMDMLNKLKDEISNIYIVCTYDDGFAKKEYVKDYFYTLIQSNPKVSIFERENLGGSYASWHSILNEDNNQSDYMVFVEDDYALTETGISSMLDYYKETPDMIYLCQLWNPNRYAGHGVDITGHAQISNGMINVKLYNKLKLENGLDFTLYFYPGKEAIYSNQVSFLEQYRSNGIIIRDMKEKYSCVFNCDSDTVINLCNPNGPDVFIPITNWYPNHNPNLRYNW
jgi:hypothetical protein